MKLGRFIVDSHVHAQRFAAGKAFKEKIGKDTDKASYTDLAGTMALLEPYDNSARLLYDMDIYSVDMCVLLPAFGMTNELNAELVERHPEHFVAVCSAVETAQKAGRGEAPWTAEAAAAECDELLSSGKFVGLGEGFPADAGNRSTLGQVERLEQIRPTMEVAQKHGVPVRMHTGVIMGYPLTHHFWPETLNPMWATDLAVEYPDVPIILEHGGLQGWWSERLVEEALCVAAANDNVFLETGLWWSDLYKKALMDPNIGAEKLLWGCDWGASIPFHAQYDSHPPAYAVQVRKQKLVRHQIDVWGWSLKQLWRLDIVQDDLNLILGGNAARLYQLPVPHKRLFRPAYNAPQEPPVADDDDSIAPQCC
ncbi:MAG TPA: amidohydrolase family protein [Alphaproteobacteria bacterium]|jgi:predicted TIM-barrel fold metal-dependent hydrolase|nr:amidohydrolase family protein [Alphaproteobacteria bacterium]